MDNNINNTPDIPQDDALQHELLSQPELGEEIMPDEQAILAAGLLHPADAELEQIIQEAHAQDPQLSDELTAEPLYAEAFPVAEDLQPVDAPAYIEQPPYAAEPQCEVDPQYAQEPQYAEDSQFMGVPLFVDVPQFAEEPQFMEEPPFMEETQFMDEPQYPDELLLSREPDIAAQPSPVADDAATVYMPDPPVEDPESSYAATPVSTDETLVLPMAQEEQSFIRDIPGMDLVSEEPEAPTPEPPAQEEEPLPKRRPKMKKGYGLLGIPHIIATAIWLAIAALIGVSLGRAIWACAADVLAFGRESSEVVITVSDGDNIDTIAAKLKSAGLIKYPGLFKLYAEITDAEEEISPGTFTLNTIYDYHALVNSMNNYSSVREETKVMIPEGYTCAQIFALLEEEGVCTVAELEAYAATGELGDYWFLEGVTRGTPYCLEGYLFPDTYKFYLNDDPDNVLAKMLNNFDNRFTDIMKAKVDSLNERMGAVLASRGYSQEEIEKRKFTVHDIVTIASMIEKETASDSESFDISSVIYNRLTNPANYPYLNIDATLIYALDGNLDPVTGETKPLTSADLEMDHPYNTYTVKGLIPGPIANPGLSSLNAALDPNETSYYYYVYNPNTSRHLFGRNAAEHEQNVAYVRSLKEDNE